ncbi:MAG: glutamate--tRNA ligase [Woeseiaceae bacterium]
MIRTRFAPSPTGVLHLGSIRTALFCWLYAKHCDGQFVLRIEDTDKERSTKENVNAILEGMSWLGMDYDEGPIFQTDRFERYHEIAKNWLELGKAYRCYCSKDELDKMRNKQKEKGEKIRYNGHCRDLKRNDSKEGFVLRFKNPLSGKVVVNDQVRGEVEFENHELDDLVIVRTDGSPTYNFAVVIDDADMNISHVIRGDDHLNNTPRQINMFKALGVNAPIYSHLPMILGDDGAKLSKRHGAVDIRDYREQGFIPEAILNYLVRLGWSYGDQEVFNTEEMIKLFDLSDINQSAAAFNSDKLLWLNQEYMMHARAESLVPHLRYHMDLIGIDRSDGPELIEVIEAYRERAETFTQMADACRYCYEEFDEIDPKAIKKQLRPVILEPMIALHSRLKLVEEWSHEIINACVNEVASIFDINMGKIGQPLRVAVTGISASPPIHVTLCLIGQERTLKRLERAIEIIKKRAESN